MKTKKHSAALTALLSVLACLVLTLGVLHISISAEDADANEDSYTGGSAFVDYLDISDTESTGGNWKAGYKSRLTEDTEPGTSGFISYSDSVAGVMNFPEPLSCMGYSEVGILITPMKSNVTVTLRVKFSETVATHSVYFDKVAEYYVYVPVTNEEETLVAVSFVADFSAREDKEPVSMVQAATPVLSSVDHREGEASFSSFNPYWEYGKEGSGVAAFVGEGIICDKKHDSDVYVAELIITGGSGSVSFFYSSPGAEPISCGSAVIRSDRTSYMFALPDTAGLSLFSVYRAEFTGADAEKTVLQSVRLYPIHVPDSSLETGEITECTFADGNVRISGSVTRDTVVNYNDSSICLYRVMPWDVGKEDTVLAGEPVARVPMSSSFEFSVKATTAEYALATYIVAVECEDGVLPVCDALFPQTKNATAESRPFSRGIAGVGCEEAFIAGYDRLVVDVDADALFTTLENSNGPFVCLGTTYYPCRDIVKELRETADFLDAAGIELMLRIVGESVYDPYDEASVKRLSAAVSYLSREFDTVGIILSSEGEGASERAELIEGAKRTSLLIRISSILAQGRAPIILEETVSPDSASFLWYLTGYMSRLYGCSYEYLIVSDGGVGTNTAESAIGDAGFTGHVIRWMRTTAADSAELCGSVSPSGNRSVVIEVTDGETLVPLSDRWETVQIVADADKYDKKVTLFDFQNSRDLGCITTSIGSDGLYMRNSTVLESITDVSTGVMRTVLDSAAPVIIMAPASPLDLRGMPVAELLMGICTDSSAVLDVVFISGGSRAVYSVQATADTALRLTCDLSSARVASSVDRIAFVLREGDALTLEVASLSVRGEGDGVSEEELYVTQGAVSDNDGNDSPSKPQPSSGGVKNDRSSVRKTVALAGAAVATVVVFMLISIGNYGKKRTDRKKDR